MNTANNLLIPLVATAVTLLIFVLIYILAQRNHKQMQSAWGQVAERLGMSDQNSGGIYPVYNGRFNQIDIGLDVIQQTYVTSRDAGTAKRPWTRVYAKLSQPPPFQLRSRHQQAAKPDLPTRPTGDTAFDEKYELFAPEAFPIDAILPPKLKSTLLNANPPVHVINGRVFWTHIKIVRDAEKLEQALRSCVAVAAVLEEG